MRVRRDEQARRDVCHDLMLSRSKNDLVADQLASV